MKTFLIHTLGCKVNQYETQQLRQLLEDEGLSSVAKDDSPDLVVVNSCCVTGTASAKSRQAVRKIRLLYPKAQIFLTGCLAIADAPELQALTDSGIRIVREKQLFSEIIKGVLSPESTQNPQSPSKPLNRDKIKDKKQLLSSDSAKILKPLKSYSGQCRAFLKIQDGCDAFCSYCIIPQIRTDVCNKDVKTVLIETRNLVLSGHKEIVLSGIFLGAYGQDTARRKNWIEQKKDALAGLLEKVVEIEGLQRIRLSSLEPADVTPRLLEVYKNNPKIMPHLHLPLQSGSENILRRMCRQYTIAEYMDIIGRIQSALDRPAITTDIIVGFPGETDEDFEKTLEISEKVGFSKIHVFPFSVRKGTSAAKMTGKVAPDVIKERAHRLGLMDKLLQIKFRNRFIGQKARVLVETIRPPQGRCERYFMVNLANHPQKDALKRGDIVEIIC